MIKLMKNQEGFTPIILLVGVLVVTIVGVGVYYLEITKNNTPESTQPAITYQNNPQSAPDLTKQSTPTDETASWKVFNISECLVTFKYPNEWQNHLSNKDQCTVHYTKPAVSGQPIDTFIIFDVQPEVFMGKQNIEIDENKVINKNTLNGIEQTTTYSEEKGKNRPIYLSNKNFFFKKGLIYFRIISQYEKGDKDFENILDKVAESVAISGDETFYNNYVKKLESELGNFAPKNK